MAKQDAGAGADLENRTQAWLEALEQAISGRRRADFDGLFLEDSYWRDMVSLTWDTCQFWGRDALRDAVFEAAAQTGFTDLRLDPDRSAPRVATFQNAVTSPSSTATKDAAGSNPLDDRAARNASASGCKGTT